MTARRGGRPELAPREERGGPGRQLWTGFLDKLLWGVVALVFFLLYLLWGQIEGVDAQLQRALVAEAKERATKDDLKDATRAIQEAVKAAQEQAEKRQAGQDQKLEKLQEDVIRLRTLQELQGKGK